MFCVVFPFEENIETDTSADELETLENVLVSAFARAIAHVVCDQHERRTRGVFDRNVHNSADVCTLFWDSERRDCRKNDFVSPTTRRIVEYIEKSVKLFVGRRCFLIPKIIMRITWVFDQFSRRASDVFFFSKNYRFNFRYIYQLTVYWKKKHFYEIRRTRTKTRLKL